MAAGSGRDPPPLESLSSHHHHRHHPPHPPAHVAPSCLTHTAVHRALVARLEPLVRRDRVTVVLTTTVPDEGSPWGMPHEGERGSRHPYPTVRWPTREALDPHIWGRLGRQKLQMGRGVARWLPPPSLGVARAVSGDVSGALPRGGYEDTKGTEIIRFRIGPTGVLPDDGG